MPYDLKINEYNTKEPTTINLRHNLTVFTFPLKHRIPTMGFKFVETIKEYNLRTEAIEEYDMNIEEIKVAKKGGSIFREGLEISYERLTLPNNEPRIYAYCSDTVYDPDLVPYIEGSTLLYHETTYLDDMAVLAEERMHTTLGQAIDIAKSANIDHMIVGHYSSRYQDTEIFMKQGLPKYDGLLLGEEGKVYQV